MQPFSPRSVGNAAPNAHAMGSTAGTTMGTTVNAGAMKNLMTATTTSSNDMFSPRKHEKYIQGKADDVLREHGASGTQAEVDALHSILDNINV